MGDDLGRNVSSYLGWNYRAISTRIFISQHVRHAQAISHGRRFSE